MEIRTVDYYRKEPSILRYCLKGRDPKAPEVAAIALAIINKKNIILKPEYADKVFIYGQVGTPSDSNPEIQCCDWIETTPIREVFFEKVLENGITSLRCYVKTKNTTYRIWDNEMARMTAMHFLLEDIQERDLTLDDLRDYLQGINTNYPEVEVIG